MKTIRRCAKLEHKLEEESDISSDKQGTYYQFLIERKVPNGIIRHIPSLINVTYEFIPDNYESKRRKVMDGLEPKFEYNSERKENENILANIADPYVSNDLNVIKNLELKRLEDKSVKPTSIKDIEVISNQLKRTDQSGPKSTGPTEADTPDIIQICKQYKNKLVMKKSLSHYPKESELAFLKKQKLIPCNLKMGSRHLEKWANPSCSGNAKYFITYVPKGEKKLSKSHKKFGDLSLKRSRSMHHNQTENPSNLGIKRNPKVKYVKAEVFKKHERLRDQIFENKIWELVSFNITNNQHADGVSFAPGNNSNYVQNMLENSNGIESLEDDSDEEQLPAINEDFIIAQHYGSFDEEDKFNSRDWLNSNLSSMNGESIHGDFNLEIVGNKIDIPKLDAEHQFGADSNKHINGLHLGSKITFGEPSGDVFGLAFDNQCNGIFTNIDVPDFQPINTLQTDN